MPSLTLYAAPHKQYDEPEATPRTPQTAPAFQPADPLPASRAMEPQFWRSLSGTHTHYLYFCVPFLTPSSQSAICPLTIQATCQGPGPLAFHSEALRGALSGHKTHVGQGKGAPGAHRIAHIAAAAATDHLPMFRGVQKK
eukprot:CAMPEP_0174355264 /NCGR_PEP_ID=MMETSP0811_2-20130205/23613_1 /TAXON_ID=73025 ORGANISM="Eutreptiella gymnastica-like, Strain CCMP1594" /NCGR_SAMPLE_ID=MMETSP0811_2 /ASSEMBLY_ACC=CAM_ASM_000667 /LENGTH=139 /DNA_ID=CAMNT_0015486521 /DNA_START=531 /DNA_END=947 /DNA_ORIENTATION=+